jgi:hypothetical protein
LSGKEILAALSGIRGYPVLFIDTCHAANDAGHPLSTELDGTVNRLKKGYRRLRGGNRRKEFARVTDLAKRCIHPCRRSRDWWRRAIREGSSCGHRLDARNLPYWACNGPHRWNANDDSTKSSRSEIEGAGQTRTAARLGSRDRARRIVAEARWLVQPSAVLTVLAALLTLNGFFLLVELPLE